MDTVSRSVISQVRPASQVTHTGTTTARIQYCAIYTQSGRQRCPSAGARCSWIFDWL